MSIIGLIEIDTGPSKLDEQLESLKGPDGDINLSPKAARRILFDRLLAHYMDSAQEVSPAVVVLARIAGESDEEEINFTAELEKFMKEREEKLEAIRQIEAKANISIVGPKITQPEI